MTIRALGAIRVAHEGEEIRLQPAARNIFAVLVAAGPDGLSADSLAEEIWGDQISPTWDNNLRAAIHRMRRALSMDAIASGGRHYALRLPTDEVDVWQLLDHQNIDLSRVDDDRLRSLLTDRAYTEPFECPLLHRNREAIEAARIELLDRVRIHAIERVTPSLLTATGQLSRTTWNEDLLCAVVELHAAAGQPGVALEVAKSGRTRLEDDLAAPVGHRLMSLLTRLESDSDSTGPASEGGDAPLAAATWRGPSRIGEIASTYLHRHPLYVAALSQLNTGGTLITGESGSGKTVLARSIAAKRHEDGNHVVWIVGQRGGGAAYGPLARVFPDLAESLTIGGDDDEESIAETRRRAFAQKHLLTVCPDRPITLVVDDAQWLDSHTSGLIEYLAGSTDAKIEAVLVGRTDDDAPDWLDALDRLRRAGITETEVGAFDSTDLTELVGRIHPRASSRQRTELAASLIASRGNLPLVATDLIASADPDTLTLPDFDARSVRWTDVVWTEAISEQTARTAAAAALVGVTWSFSDVLAITDGDEDDLSDAVDELLDAQLIESGTRPDQFVFRHVLIQEAFAASLDTKERRRVHRDSAEQADRAGRVHDRARHLLAAGAGVNIAHLVEALLVSAQAHLVSRSWLEAVRAFAIADRIEPDRLDTLTLSAYAVAIERSGGDATELRTRAVDTADADDDPELMLTVILSGADGGELLESDANRLRLIERVPRDRLCAASQLRYDTTLCRELGLAGQPGRARELYLSMAPTTTDEHAAAWLAVWSSVVGTPPATWPVVSIDASLITDPVDRARVRNTDCETALARGDRATFDAGLALLAAESASQQHPTRRWALALLESMRAQVDGDRDTAERLADAGLAIGIDAGLAGAFPARSAQVFADHWTRGCHVDLVPLLDLAPPDLRDSLLATAARSIALFELPDRVDEARADARSVLERLQMTTTSVHASIAVLMTEAVDHLDPAERDQLRATLAPHAGMPVVMSAGIAHLGPADRALAKLASDAAEAEGLLRSAVVQSDRWQLPIWSVRCRLDLHRATGDPEALATARSIAAEHGLTTPFFTG